VTQGVCYVVLTVNYIHLSRIGIIVLMNTL